MRTGVAGKFLLINIILIFSFNIVSAQSIYDVQRKQDSLGLYPMKFGLFVDYGINTHAVNKFYQIKDVPLGTSDAFPNGSGSGISVGGFLDYPFSEKLSLMTRLGYFSLNGSFTNTGLEPTAKWDSTLNDFVPVNAKIGFTIDASLAVIGFEPLLTYELIKNLKIHAGPNLGYLFSKTFKQDETLLNYPEAPKFSDGSTVRNDTTADITNASSILFGITGGISYEIQISKNLMVAPEFYYSLGLNNITSDTEFNWSVSSMRFGGAVRYIGNRPCPPGMTRNAEGNCEELPCPPGQIRNEDGDCECRKGMFVNKKGDCEWPPCNERNFVRTELGDCIQVLYAEIKSEPILSSGLPAETDNLTLKEAESVTYQPMLNFIFFDEGKPEIPKRYKKFNSDDATVDFTEEKVADESDILKTYYNILNIIGYRLSTNPFANVLLQSYNMGGSESNNANLPEQRIDSVSRYLQDMWKILDYRIKKQVYNLPPEVAQSGDKSLLAEYRRVEIIVDSANMDIIKPVKLNNIVYRLYPSKINFNFDILPMSGIDSWEFGVTQGDNLFYSNSGTGDPPKLQSWYAGTKANIIDPGKLKLDYTLKVKDKNGDKKESSKSMSLDLMRFDPERKPDESDSSFAIHYFLFNDKDIEKDIKKNMRFLNNIEFDKYTSMIKITSYTDKTGDASKNRNLSSERIDAMVDFLKSKKELNEARVTKAGIGGEELYDNSVPEGRFYNRTVIVDIATPRKEKEKAEDLVEGCVVIIFSDEDEQKAKSVLSFLEQKGAKDVVLEKYYIKSLEKNQYRVRSKVYPDLHEAVVARAKLSLYLRQLTLDKPPELKCSKKDQE